jgi:hypothetical protein
VTLTIQRLATRAEIPQRLKVNRSLIDDVAHEWFSVECARQLNRSWPAQLGVVRIRKLPVQVTLTPLQLKPDALATAWVAAFKRALFAALAYPSGVGPFETICFETRAEYLATLIRDVMAGVAADRWEYEEFGTILNLGTLEAVLVVLDQERSEIIATFLILAEWRSLDRFLDLAGDAGVQRLFRMVTSEAGTDDDELSMEHLIVVGRLLGAHRALSSNLLSFAGGYQLGGSGAGTLKLSLKLFIAIRHQCDERNAERGYSPRKISDALRALEALMELGEAMRAAGRQLDRMRLVVTDLLGRWPVITTAGTLLQFPKGPTDTGNENQREFIKLAQKLVPGLSLEPAQLRSAEFWDLFEMSTAGTRAELAALVDRLTLVAGSGADQLDTELWSILATGSRADRRELAQVLSQLMLSLDSKPDEPYLVEFGHLLAVARSQDRNELTEQLMLVLGTGGKSGADLWKLLQAAGRARRGVHPALLEHPETPAGSADQSDSTGLLEQLITALNSDTGQLGAEFWNSLEGAASAGRSDLTELLESLRKAATSAGGSDLAELLEQLRSTLNSGAGQPGSEFWKVVEAASSSARRDLGGLIERLRVAASRAGRSDRTGLLEQLRSALNSDAGQPGSEFREVPVSALSTGRSDLAGFLERLRTAARRAGRSDLARVLEQLRSALGSDAGQPGTEFQQVLASASSAVRSDLAGLFEGLRTATVLAGRNDLGLFAEQLCSTLGSQTGRSEDDSWKAFAVASSSRRSDFGVLLEQLLSALNSGAARSGAEFGNALVSAASADRSALVFLLTSLRTAVDSAGRSDLAALLEKLLSTFSSGTDQPEAEFCRVLAAAGGASRSDLAEFLERGRMAISSTGRADLAELLGQLASSFRSEVGQTGGDLGSISPDPGGVTISDLPGPLEALRTDESGRLSDLPGFLKQQTSAASSSHDQSRAPELKIVFSNCAGLFFLIRTLVQLKWANRLTQPGLGAVYGPGVLTHTLAGLGMAVLNRFEEEPWQLDPGLALFCGWMDGPDLLELRRFFAFEPLQKRRDLLSLLLGNEATEGSSENWKTCFDILAIRVIDEFARRLRGFGRASRTFVLKNFLALPGRVRVEETHLVVHLAASPLNVVLHLSGMDDPVGSVSWLGGRRIEFHLEGL